MHNLRSEWLAAFAGGNVAPMAELMDATYEPPSSDQPRVRSTVGPAIDLAKLNPGRWIKVSTHSTVASARSRLSGLKKNAARVYGVGIEFRRDRDTIIVRYTPPGEDFAPPPDAPPDDDPDIVPDPPAYDPPPPPPEQPPVSFGAPPMPAPFAPPLPPQDFILGGLQ